MSDKTIHYKDLISQFITDDLEDEKELQSMIEDIEYKEKTNSIIKDVTGEKKLQILIQDIHDKLQHLIHLSMDIGRKHDPEDIKDFTLDLKEKSNMKRGLKLTSQLLTIKQTITKLVSGSISFGMNDKHPSPDPALDFMLEAFEIFRSYSKEICDEETVSETSNEDE